MGIGYGVRGDHIQVAPPPILTEDQIVEMVDLLDRSLWEAERSL